MVLSGLYFPAILVSILLINATYGGGFSTCPSILSDNYDSNSLSRVHGAVLSAWGFASLFAYCIMTFALKFLDGYALLPVILAVVYAVNLINVILLGRHVNNS